MAEIRVARRYAEAIMRGAEEQKVLGEVSKDFELLDRLLKESREFRVFLKSPVINRIKKQSVLREMLEKKTHRLTMSFLELLTEKGREDSLQEIVCQYFVLRDAMLGIVNVEIKAAAELSREQHEQLQKKFEHITRKQVRLGFSLDKQLKGGFVARIGDTMFDGSVRRQLELLRERFAEGTESN